MTHSIELTSMHIDFNRALRSLCETYPSNFNRSYINREICLAGYNVRLCFLGQRLVDHYFPAMQHLEILGDKKAIDLTVYVLESSILNNIGIDKLVEIFFQTAQKKTGLTANLSKLSTDHYLNLGDFLYYYSESSKFGFWIIENLNTLSPWHFANPLRFFWSDFLIRKNIQVSHVASVSNNHSAVLLAGPSGAGKSSTALAASEQPLNFLGDDHCMFDTTHTPHVFSLYNSVKIDEKNISKFQKCHFKPIYHIKNAGINKAVLYFHDVKNDYEKKPIKAILKLDKSHSEGNQAILCKISKTEILQSLVLSTISQFHWVNPKLVIKNHQVLVDKIPGYCLRLSKDFEKNTKLIQRVLDE